MFFCGASVEGGGAPHIILGTGRNYFMQFSLNGRPSKLDFNNAQLTIVFEREIKMVVISRKKV